LISELRVATSSRKGGEICASYAESLGGGGEGGAPTPGLKLIYSTYERCGLLKRDELGRGPAHNSKLRGICASGFRRSTKLRVFFRRGDGPGVQAKGKITTFHKVGNRINPSTREK